MEILHQVEMAISACEDVAGNKFSLIWRGGRLEVILSKKLTKRYKPIMILKGIEINHGLTGPRWLEVELTVFEFLSEKGEIE